MLDPQTGAIQAMASYSDVRPALFTRGFSKRSRSPAWRGTASPGESRDPGAYPPGRPTSRSWRRPLQTDIVTTGQSHGCPPSWTVPFDESDPEAMQYVFNNWTTADLGFMNLSTALAGLRHGLLSDGVPLLGHVLRQRRRATTASSRTNLAGRPRELRVRRPDAGRSPLRTGRVAPTPRKQSIHEQHPESFPEGAVPRRLHPDDDRPGGYLTRCCSWPPPTVRSRTTVGSPHVLDRVVAPDDTIVRRFHQNCRRHVRIDERYCATCGTRSPAR